MSGGGGTTKTTSDPWKPAQPYLLDIMRQGSALQGQTPTFYTGPLTVGPTEAEGAAWQSRNQFNNSVFGGSQAPQYGDLTRTVSAAMGGDTDLGSMSGAISPYATSTLLGDFSRPDTSGISGIRAPGATNSAGQIGNYGFGTTLDPSGRAPTFGTAGGLDARGAFAKALEGTPDYSGAQGAIDAANAPILRQLTDEIIPGLNQRATFTNNSTGGIKSLNRVLPQIGERMGENAQNIMNAERLRSLDAQERARDAITQGGFQGYGLGLSTAQGERGLEQALAGLGLNADSTRAGYMLNDFGTGLSGAQLGLQREGMLTDTGDRYRSDLLGLGGLGASLAGQAGGQQLSAASMFPGVYDLGRSSGNDAMDFAAQDRALQERALGADRERFDYLRDQPYNNLGWYSNLINGLASPYGTQTQRGGQGSSAGGLVGGLLSLAGLF